MGDSRLRCKNCGKELVENERPCQACGSENRLYSIHITEQVEIVDSLEAAHSE